MSTPLPNRAAPLKPVPPAAGDFSLKYLLEIFFRRKRTLLLPVLLTPLLALLLSFAIPARYMSTTTILLGKSEILNPLVRYDTAVSLADENRLGSFQKIIYSRPLIEETIRALGLERQAHTPLELEALVNRIRGGIHLFGLSGDSFQLGCSAPEPVQAQRLVDTISRLFIDKSLEGSRREAKAAVNFIQKQLDHYQAELERIEGRLQGFRREHAESLRQSNSLAGQLENTQAKRLDAELELKQEQLNEQLLSERLKGEKPMVVSQALFVQNTPYQRQYQELQIRLGNLLATRERSHPEVQKLQREMDFIVQLLEDEKKKNQASETQEVRSPVYQEVTARREDCRIKIKVLEQKIAEYQRLEGGLRGRLLELPELEKEQQRLEGEVKLTREVYDTLKIKLEHARVSCEVEIEQQTNRFTIIDPPLVPLARYQPIRKTFVLGGLAGGLCLGLMLILLLEFSDPRLVRPGDLTRRLGLRLLGVMPKLYHYGEAQPFRFLGWLRLPRTRLIDGLQRARLLWPARRLRDGLRALLGARRFVLPAQMAPDFVVSPARLQQTHLSDAPEEEALDGYIEHIRHIALTAQAAYAEPGPRVWLVASAKPAEGKTLIAANLGVLLASDLQRPVLLIDANLPAPRLSTLFGRGADGARAPGLAEVIEGRATLEQALAPTGVPHLSLLPAGAAAGHHPEQLLHSEACRQLFERLRARFAVVLIEAPNLIAHSEGLLLAPHTDGVLVVTRLYASKQKAVEAALFKLPADKLLGLVPNYAEYWIPGWLYQWV